MTAKERVRAVYPKAACLKINNSLYRVYLTRGSWAGRAEFTRSEAWESAALRHHEGARRPHRRDRYRMSVWYAVVVACCIVMYIIGAAVIMMRGGR
jgi:hypothetical protein